jgi:Kef-type K+ transport system membrane component KefB
VAFALALGWLAGRLHLAPIVGAFAAGLILTRTEHQAHLQTVIKPVADVFVPVFFVLIGAAVDVRLLNPFVAEHHATLVLAGALTLVAIAGKLAAGLGTLRRGVDRWTIGIGMIPRGEVGLIFAGVGLGSHIIGDSHYAAIVTMVTVTTLLAPLLLGMALRR